jgi:hypothetical protein
VVITEEVILERLQKLRSELDQMRANLAAYEGAIQDCEYWLDQLKNEPEPEEADAS